MTHHPDLHEAVFLAGSLAQVLDGWTFVPPPPGITTLPLTHSDGRRILITLSGGRATLAAQPPPGRCDWQPLAITVRLDRGPAVIAREVVRRLLPAYVTAWAAGVAEAHAHEVEAARDRAGRQATADLLASLAPPHRVSVSHPAADNRASVSWSSGVNGPFGVGDVHLNHDGTVVTELRIRWLPAEAAARVLAALHTPQETT